MVLLHESCIVNCDDPDRKAPEKRPCRKDVSSYSQNFISRAIGKMNVLRII